MQQCNNVIFGLLHVDNAVSYSKAGLVEIKY